MPLVQGMALGQLGLNFRRGMPMLTTSRSSACKGRLTGRSAPPVMPPIDPGPPVFPSHLQTTSALWPPQTWPQQGGQADLGAVLDQRGRVLVVEDDVLLAKQVQACLADLAELQVALTADDALRLCLQSPPDLLLLDLQLGGGDGRRLLDALRAHPSLAPLPVLVISASNDPALAARAAGLAVRRRLDKPLEANLLREAVQSVLQPDRAASALQPGPWPPTVLAIDDDPIARAALAAALSDDGLRLITAADAAGALARTAQWVPDVVLLDIGMPGIDGFQLARQLMAQPRLADVPVIFVTGRGETEAELRALALGAFDFVSKPFLPEVLRARVGNALRLRQRTLQQLLHAEAHWRRVSGEQLAAIVAHAQDAILSVQADGHVLLANAAAEQLLATPDDPLAGATLPDWLRAALPAALLAGQQRCALGLVLCRPGGTPRTYDLAAVVDHSADQRLVTLTLHDQTPRIEAETQLREQARRDAEQHTRQLMVSYLAHEIGNPLAGILGMARLMLDSSTDPLSPQQARRLRLMLDSAEVLHRLSSDTLALARWGDGQFSVVLQPVPLRPLLAQALAEQAIAAQAAGISHWNGPPEGAEVLVQADPVRLRQCLHNLLSNACKYGAAGDRVWIELATSDRDALITVADAGSGLSPEQQARLFAPFERLGRSDRPGHGLGLAITRLLAQAMQGGLTVQAGPAIEGSRFTLRLPLAACTDSTADGDQPRS
jgi:signal transduction histidine kinase